MIRALWIITLIAMTVAAQAGNQFDDAKAAYDAGKLEEARRLYEDGLRTNADANMLINHGSVCFRLGDLGRAILSFERALIASPSNPDAADNLKFARSRSGARIPEPGWKEVVLSAVPRKV